MTQLTQEQFDELSALISSGDRGGYYVRYYEFTGSEQALRQGQISLFSGFLGGAGLATNALAKWYENNLGGGYLS